MIALTPMIPANNPPHYSQLGDFYFITATAIVYIMDWEPTIAYTCPAIPYLRALHEAITPNIVRIVLPIAIDISSPLNEYSATAIEYRKNGKRQKNKRKQPS